MGEIIQTAELTNRLRQLLGIRGSQFAPNLEDSIVPIVQAWDASQPPYRTNPVSFVGGASNAGLAGNQTQVLCQHDVPADAGGVVVVEEFVVGCPTGGLIIEFGFTAPQVGAPIPCFTGELARREFTTVQGGISALPVNCLGRNGAGIITQQTGLAILAGNNHFRLSKPIVLQPNVAFCAQYTTAGANFMTLLVQGSYYR